MPDLVPYQRSQLLQVLLAKAMAPPPPYGAPTRGSAFAQAINRGFDVYRAGKEMQRQEEAQKEGAALGQQAIDALTPQTTTTSSYDSSKDTGYDPNASGDMGGGGVLSPGMTVQQSQTAPDVNRALALALQGAQKGDATSGALAQALLQQRLAQMMPQEAMTPYQQEELKVQQKNAESSRISANAAAARAGSSGEGGTFEERLLSYPPDVQKKLLDLHTALQGKGMQLYDSEGNLIFSSGGSGDPLTGPQAGKQFADFQDQAEASLNGLTTTQHLIDTVTQNSKALGVPGTMASIANEATQAVQNTLGWAPADAKKLDELLSRNDDDMLKAFGPLRATAIQNAQFKSDTIRLAYSLARAAGNTGNSLSNKDFDKFLSSIGATTSDPAAFGFTIKNLNKQSVANLENAYTAKFKGTARDAEAKQRVDAVKQKYDVIFGGNGTQKGIGNISQAIDSATTPEELDALEKQLSQP